MDMLHQHLFESVYLLLLSGDGDSKAVCDPSYYHFSIDSLCKENHFREYFGPSDLKTIYDFCQILDTQQQISKKPVALTVSAEHRVVTKALCLVGAYMILMLDMDEVNLADRFQGSIVPFGDVVHEDKGSEFGLDLQDCFAALSKAKDLRWVDFSPGGFDSHEYTHFDNPLNADMHEIVPGKLIAMRGPRDLPGDAEWLDVLREDGSFSHRDFSPQYYASLLHEFDVQVVVRCNTPQYDRRELENAGILVVDLIYEDGGCPPVDIMAKFMAVVEAVPGTVAVHGASGLGRSGTLIGLYMMKHHGFTAREAMGWMRIVRPGSVMGRQQDFLCSKEALMHRSGEALRAAPPPPPLPLTGPVAGLESVRRAVEAAVRAVDAKHAAVRAAAASLRTSAGSFGRAGLCTAATVTRSSSGPMALL